MAPMPPGVALPSPPCVSPAAKPHGHHHHHHHQRGWKLGYATLVMLAGFVSTLLLGGALALMFFFSDAPPEAEPVVETPVPAKVFRPAANRQMPAANFPPQLSAKALQEKMLREVFQNEATSGSTEAANLEASRRIDDLVRARLKAKDIPPAPLCSDAVFVRRVYLDVIGRIPTAGEAREFLEDKNPERRRELIDILLAHPDFADYWTMKWCDLLRVKSEFPINLWPNAVQAYHRWLRTSVRENMPFDRFARALLTSSGSNFRDPPANFYRAMQSKDPRNIGQTVSLTFLGVRPEGWPAERWNGLAPFFQQIGYKKTSEWKEEIIVFDPNKPIKRDEAVFPDGKKAVLSPDQDPREVFANWLIQPDNPWFTRNIANRAWSWLVGRGIIHEPDDIRPDNPPSNPELLAYLEKELIQSKYDLRQYFRIILNSRTYQASSIPASSHPEAAALFACYPVRRLDAEVLIDAICQITGTNEKYSSPIPEPFTYIPESHRSVALADASITSAFLEMFGRPSRDTGMESERNNSFTPAQRLHMLNSTHILQKIEQGPGLAALRNSGKKPIELADDLYLTILSRYPNEDERSAMADYAQTGSWGRRPVTDIAWALINSAEFLCRH
ncbi:MAG: DUF1553 domain-containing protein [Gemmataceae bacterium]